MKKITEEWIEKAEGDFKVAVRESDAEEPVYDAVCFHCHQCIEKYMKAILVENNDEFEKIHDLEALEYSCRRYMSGLEKNLQDLIWLTQFSVRVRYPGFGASKKDARKATSIMKRLRNMIKGFFSTQ